MHSLRAWSCTNHVADHSLITWLIMHWSWSGLYTDHVTCMHSSRSWSYTDHVTVHTLITWLIMHWSPGSIYPLSIIKILEKLILYSKNAGWVEIQVKAGLWLTLAREDPLEEEMAIHSSILAWKIPWTEESDRLQSMGSQRVGYNWETSLSLSLSWLTLGGYNPSLSTH